MDKIEEKIIKIIDDNREKIVDFARDIYTHAELGYKEFRTAGKFADELKALGLETKEGLAVTGVKGYLNQDKKDNVSLALIGELDALRIPDHKYANEETSGAHCCGHHSQLAGVVGAALALADKEVAAALDGQVVFFAVPAEEYGEIEFKNKLKNEGKIRYGGGKCELIRIGAFDDIDINLAHHTAIGNEVVIRKGSGNGFVSKVIRYKGKAAHAAGSPHLGVNALNAASIGLTALQYQRETFQDKDTVRVHPIMTKGGDLVNVIPNEAVIETLVRANNTDAILDASKKTDRAFLAGAVAVGAQGEIETMPGYLPTIPVDAPEELVEAARLAADDKYNVNVFDGTNKPSGGSTDVGDLQHIQPVFTFNTGGAAGSGLHSVDFDINDEELAYIVTAKIFALTTYRFLKGGAAAARKLVNDYKPIFTKQEYIDFMESMISTKIGGEPYFSSEI